MDARVALLNGVLLNLKGAEKEYIIKNELGRGGSCIVYDAFYYNNSGAKKSVRIKECYPFKLEIIRKDDNQLCAREEDLEHFEEYKVKFREAFDRNNMLFETENLANYVVNTYEIYEANNTLYVVTLFSEGKTLKYDEVTSIKQAVSIMKNVSRTIGKIHKAGFLYLDIKPDNIFVMDDTGSRIQLFDFDSLIPVDKKGNVTDYRTSYTKGFVALEQQQGNIKKIGKYTDVYGIGAVFFWLLFNTTPTARNCDSDAVYDFKSTKYGNRLYRDKLFFKISQFLHRTLAHYYADRYQSMEEVVSALEEISLYATETDIFIPSSAIIYPKLMVGREEERMFITAWLKGDGPCLFLSGMGGIGKSTLVRKCIYDNQDVFNAVVYLSFEKSIVDTITDDKHFFINTVSRDESESKEEYFLRKVKAIKEIGKDLRTLLVLDNFVGDIGKDFMELTDSGMKVLVITRQRDCGSFKHLPLEPISDEEALHEIFETNVGHAISEEDSHYAKEIIKCVSGNTLMLTLVAKQISKSYMSFCDACGILKKERPIHMASEKLRTEKDGCQIYDSMGAIIAGLYKAAGLSDIHLKILRALELFGQEGIEIDTFTKLANLDTKDEINELYDAGWLEVNYPLIYIHPVICDAIFGWDLSDDVRTFLGDFLSLISLTSDIRLMKTITERAGNYESLAKSSDYAELRMKTLLMIGIDEEDFIIKYGSRTLKENACDITYANLETALAMEDDFTYRKDVMKIFDKVIHVLCQKGDFEEAEKMLEMAETFSNGSDSFIRGAYFDLVSSYYDNYYAGDFATDLTPYMDALDRATECYANSTHPESFPHLAEDLLCIATLLIREDAPMDDETLHDIDGLFIAARQLIDEHGLNNTQSELSYYLNKGWYYTYIMPDVANATSNLDKALEMVNQVYKTDIDIIDNCLIPVANIFYELNQKAKSFSYLKRAIEMCERHAGVGAYERKMEELEGYMEE